MKLNKSVTELLDFLETEPELKLDEGELIRAQEALSKIKNAASNYHQKVYELKMLHGDFYEHKLTETDLHHVLELLEKHRLNCKDFDDLVQKYQGYYEAGDDLKISYTNYSRSWGYKDFLHWSDVLEEDLLKGKKNHLWQRARKDLFEKFPLMGYRERYGERILVHGRDVTTITEAILFCKRYSKERAENARKSNK